jgi:L-threonylcarbamoyladenylate synthase
MAQALVAALDAPVVGTSANLSGAPPATRVEELAPEVLGGVEGVLDGGILPGGAPSTVLDCTRWPPTVVREGAVPREALQEIVPLG